MAWDTLFNEFPSEDQQVWTGRGWAWYQAHHDHVESLIKEEDTSYSPSGSDCGKPELWKDGHWRWFFKLGR